MLAEASIPKIVELHDNIYKVEFSSKRELLESFLRFQEYYESPEFKHKIFDLEEFKEWYVKFYNIDHFSYYEDWEGCNVPSYVFVQFRKGYMNPLSEEERRLLDLIPDKKDKYYVIGVYDQGDPEVIQHEICHGLFYTRPDYKAKVLEAIGKYDVSSVKEYVRGLGYHESVILDEVNAYLSTSPDYLKDNGVHFDENLQKTLKSLLDQELKITEKL
jgi:hypothetical protein